MVTEGLEAIAEASQRYGGDPMYVFGGGGNTSFKTDEHLYVKPSGVTLAEIESHQVVKMDRAKIQAFFETRTPEDPDAREALVKDAMAAAVAADSSGRASVEAPLHHLLPTRYVVHMHPVLVNGMTCSVQGEAVAARLFPEALWVEYVDPGYTLASVIYKKLTGYVEEHGKAPQVILLQSHGVFVSADSIEEIDAIYADLNAKLQAEYDKAGVTAEVATTPMNMATVREWGPRLRSLLGDDTTRAVVHAGDAFDVFSDPLTPDHIVYSRSYAFVGEPTPEALNAFEAERGYKPRVVSIPGQAVFAVEANLKSARLVMESAHNACRMVNLTAAFGGVRVMTGRESSFIDNWEVESYRRNVSKGLTAKPLTGKVVLVTGAAQGFGYGIAGDMADHGATVVVADMNAEGAEKAAAELCEKHGASTAFATTVNVTDEESVAAMADAVVRECGGVDVMIANAGVLRAGSVKSLSKSDWDLVNAVNYSGYFLCVKHFSAVMAQQNADGMGPWTDIIQISSKSGLQGSNRNAAYAGSKFGGIGLTQSFAMELVTDKIKVNSICPGNFFDGPLWADPDNGLFVQYLRSGKVPGATTVDEVREHYEKLVPMGRGCYPEDVSKAILYVIGQQYETGQAIPVTGGQIMLN